MRCWSRVSSVVIGGGIVALLLATSGVGLADEWGTWDDLPDNLMESGEDVTTLDELSRRLDNLIRQEDQGDRSVRNQLLRAWLDQLNNDARRNISLDDLLEWQRARGDDEDFEEWYDDLEDYLNSQESLAPQGQKDVDGDDEGFDDDDDGPGDEDDDDDDD